MRWAIGDVCIPNRIGPLGCIPPEPVTLQPDLSRIPACFLFVISWDILAESLLELLQWCCLRILGWLSWQLRSVPNNPTHRFCSGSASSSLGPDWWIGDRYRRFEAAAMLKVRNLGEFEGRSQTTCLQSAKKHSRPKHSPRSRPEMLLRCTRNCVGCCGELVVGRPKHGNFQSPYLFSRLK